MSDLCLTLAETSLGKLEDKIDRYQGKVSLIEIRLDFLDTAELPTLPSSSKTKFLATCRPRREGGLYEGEERPRLARLEKAARAGFAWVDLEHDVQEGVDLPSSTRVVRSLHRFDTYPAGLSSVLRRLSQLGQVGKIAVQITGTRDLVRLLDWMGELPRDLDRVLVGMGDWGRPSRLLGHFLGNRWTYVREDGQEAVAAGQFGLAESIELYRLTRRRPVERFFGVIGNPVGHSLSPLLHNSLFGRFGLNDMYLALPVDDLECWMAYMMRSPLDFGGLSVTAPFKQAILPFLTDGEERDGAVNTLMRQKGGWRGSNTDYHGFLLPLLRRMDPKGKTALVLGCGGVARTVVRALRDRGCRVTVAARDRRKRERFSAQAGCAHLSFADLPIQADLCVNATPVGQYPCEGESLLGAGQFPFEIAYDLVSRPARTRFLSLAKRQGCRIISGAEMFVEQAALQFETWTGTRPDRALLVDIVKGVSG